MRLANSSKGCGVAHRPTDIDREIRKVQMGEKQRLYKFKLLLENVVLETNRQEAVFLRRSP